MGQMSKTAHRVSGMTTAWTDDFLPRSHQSLTTPAFEHRYAARIAECEVSVHVSSFCPLPGRERHDRFRRCRSAAGRRIARVGWFDAVDGRRHDNRQPAGTLDGGTLTLSLRAGRGSWQPEGTDGPRLSIEALGEESAALMVPAPLIRAEEGTRIEVSLRNELDAPLQMHGLCARDGSVCPALSVPPRETRQVQFDTGRAGTYHYWATCDGSAGAVPRAGRRADCRPAGRCAGSRSDSRHHGVDQPDAGAAGDVLRADDAGKAFVALQPRVTFVINGLSWPATERLTYQLGETVRWRVINLSSQPHPMHLHGFYFEVDSLGDGMQDTPIAAADRHPVVTQLLPPASTMTMTWTPEREGNWLFHCHIMHHVSPERRLAPRGRGRSPARRPRRLGRHGGDDSRRHRRRSRGNVTGHRRSRDPGRSAQADAGHGATDHGRRAVVRLRAQRRSAWRIRRRRRPSPGPALVLRRDEPVEITVVNHLGESTALHWHGMELDSFYDGVHGWSGIDQQLAPMIEPDGSFVVRFTPPRTGTFIYHTHLHDERQLPLGLYGPMIVVDDDETFDPATDHVRDASGAAGSIRRRRTCSSRRRRSCSTARRRRCSSGRPARAIASG